MTREELIRKLADINKSYFLVDLEVDLEEVEEGLREHMDLDHYCFDDYCIRRGLLRYFERTPENYSGREKMFNELQKTVMLIHCLMTVKDYPYIWKPEPVDYHKLYPELFPKKERS